MSERSSGPYAFWKLPNSDRRVIYNLTVFYDLDAEVSDAFRRIPRGGIEEAGILFGHIEADATYIEAFRPVVLQHAAGPSFVLSEPDLQQLQDRLRTDNDSDLQDLIPVGWFVGHTRSPLVPYGQEAQVFDRFFPQPGSVAVLVKPEKFQATQFAFLLRDLSGNIPSQVPPAVILPLPGRGDATQSLRASIPAPPKRAPEEERGVEIKPDLEVQRPPIAPVPKPPVAAKPDVPVVHVARDIEPSARPERAPLRQAEIAPPRTPSFAPPPTPAAIQDEDVEPRRSAVGWLGTAAVLALAAVLGCFTGYWAYLQLPSPVIPLKIHEEQSLLIIEWPPEETRSVDYAALQMNDGSWLPLTEVQRTAGRAVIPDPPGDLRIRLIAKHWLRDSRGNARYVRP